MEAFSFPLFYRAPFLPRLMTQETMLTFNNISYSYLFYTFFPFNQHVFIDHSLWLILLLRYEGWNSDLSLTITRIVISEGRRIILHKDFLWRRKHNTFKKLKACCMPEMLTGRGNIEEEVPKINSIARYLSSTFHVKRFYFSPRYNGKLLKYWSIHLFIQRIFIDCLICPKHDVKYRGK